MNDTNSLYDLIDADVMLPQIESYLRRAISAKLPGLIMGPGKTTLLDSAVYLQNTYPRTPMVYVMQNKLIIKNRPNALMSIYLREHGYGRDDGWWVCRVLRLKADAVLCSHMRLNSQEDYMLRDAFESGISIISTLYGRSGIRAISKINSNMSHNVWAWTVSTKKAHNSVGFIIDTIYEIVKCGDTVRLHGIYRHDENTPINTILERTHYLKKHADLMDS